jgi:pyrimidine operon attenuation protein/uracil phosphoribosyltransferase
MGEQFVPHWMLYSILVSRKKLSSEFLIDHCSIRRLSIQPDYIDKSIDAIVSQKIKVFWKKKDGKDEVCLVNY